MKRLFAIVLLGFLAPLTFAQQAAAPTPKPVELSADIKLAVQRQQAEIEKQALRLEVVKREFQLMQVQLNELQRGLMEQVEAQRIALKLGQDYTFNSAELRFDPPVKAETKKN